MLIASVLLVALGVGVLVWRSTGNEAKPTSRAPDVDKPESTSTTIQTTAPETTSPASEIPVEPSDIDPLLAERVGFGAQTTGGAGGPMYHVTTGDDDAQQPAPGSLRYGLSQPEPLWIVFDDDFTITFAAGMPVTSDKTIDGRGRKVLLTGHGQPGLQIYDSHNVIVENLILSDFGDVARTEQNDPDDAIDIQNSQNIWIDHNTLSKAGDKLIAEGRGSTAITISWNHFLDQEQTVQLGNQTTGDQDVNTTVTLHHNFFDHTGYRNPVVSYGKAHVFNNYLLGWGLYGVRSERTAQVLLENDIFEAGDSKVATHSKPAGDGCNDAKTRCDDRPGYIRSVGNLEKNGARVQESEPDMVFNPSDSYPYELSPADDALAAAIVAGAGWRAE